MRGSAASSILADAAEGDQREVQYQLKADERGGGGLILWRRFDVALDDAVDGGGVASPMMSGVVSLELRAMERDKWKLSWDSDSDGLPWAVRVQVVARDESGKYEATARRVVADRKSVV